MDSDHSAVESEKNSGKDGEVLAASGPPESGSKQPSSDDPKSIATETLKRVKLTEVWLVILTGVIAASSVTTCYVYKRQLDVMQETLGEIKVSGIDTHHLVSATGSYAANMKRLAEQATSQAIQTKSLAESGKTSADAAKVSAGNSDRIARGSEAAVKATQISMRLDQRAWIGMTAFTSEQSPAADKVFLVSVRLHNTGKTPASDVTTQITMGGFLTGAGDPKIFPNHKLFGIPSHHILAPNADLDLPVYLLYDDGRQYLWTEPDVALYNGQPPKYTLYVWGRVDYDDVFGCHHWLRFCGRYELVRNKFHPCERSNEIDEGPCVPKKTSRDHH